ncbi:hypothetical protein Btru_001498 [Bulinus truncatus]|nr:hypothetical protein Btru_001498 [Bulinus truncatus]
MILYAGAGDHLIHSWDIENGTYLSSMILYAGAVDHLIHSLVTLKMEHLDSMNGHSDHIHSIALKDNGKSLISASEDGTAVIWDGRMKEASHIVKPFENEMCARPHIGKWLRCLTVDEDNY